MKKMKIRKATKEDVEKIAKIEHNSGYRWRESRREESKEAKKVLNSKYSETYIYGEIAYFSVNFKKGICYINFLSVTKSQHRKGIASNLLKKIIYFAKRNKCKEIEIGVWAKNFPAIALYNKFGFHVSGIKRKYYPNGDDKLRMQKKLK